MKEPKDMDEAIEIRTRLAKEVTALQTALGDRNRTQNGRRMNDHEYWQWRQRTKELNEKKLVELREVRAWIHKHSQNRTIEEKMQPGEGQQVISTLKLAFGDLCTYVLDLEAENALLREEIERLKKTVVSF